jgi:tetratricopeptide (TPR) repeat protein
LEDLEKLHREHPEIPRVYNYLNLAHSMLGNQEQARKVAEEGYHRHPDYLFAKVGYAQHCLEDGRLDEVEKILGDQRDLTLMYPERKKFHTSEALAFYGLMGLYMAEIGQFKTARRYYKLLKSLDPEHTTTKAVGIRILQRAFSKLQDIAERSTESD